MTTPQELTPQDMIRTLTGPQWDRKAHGGLWDRGAADSYYGRPRAPHWRPSAGQDVTDLTLAETREYLAGYDHNEAQGDFKNWD